MADVSTTLMDELAHLISRMRQDLGLTLEDLADRTGLHRTTLGLVERGERGLTIDSAARIAQAFGLGLTELVAKVEVPPSAESEVAIEPRQAPRSALRGDTELRRLTGLSGATIAAAIEYTYGTFDLIDAELVARDVQPLSGLVELANLSSMVGNLLGAGVANASEGAYLRNRPHAFPDLVPQREELPDVEIKVALETNSPKGHLPKEGVYLTFRYALGHPDGGFARGRENRGPTVWIWEVRAGRLSEDDFSCSNTPGDSGKTAVIKRPSLKAMSLVYQDDRFFPYARAWT